MRTQDTDAAEMARLEDVFGPVISRYSDEQAVEDGVLVALNDTDRVTVNAFNAIAKVAEDQPKPPSCWPVDLFGFCRAKTGDERALAMIGGLVGTERQTALKFAGLVTRYATYGPHGFRSLLSQRPDDPCTYQTLYLTANECGGVTLMLPEDN